MNKKDNIANKEAVFASRRMNCSADGHGENAKRETPEQIASLIVMKGFIHSSYAQMEKSLLKNIAAAIREAVEVEREACLLIAKDYNELESREFMSVYHAERVSDAIMLNRK